VAKLDWNISDNHRATFTYQRTKEAKPQPYSSYARDYSVILPSNWYNSASKTDNYSMQLFSDWTENFSTELKMGYQEYGAVNGAAVDQPEVYACFSATACPNNPTQISSSVPWVIAGEDRFRHQNLIDSKRFTGTLSGTYYAGDHVIKGGFDFLSNEIANAFGQLLHGSYSFYDKNGNGTPVDEILAKNYGTFVKNVIPNGVDLATFAGTWKYTQFSPFLQDTWQATDNLSLLFGVRVNIPKADRSPPVAGYQLEAQTSGGNYNPANPIQPGVWEHYFGYPSDTTLSSKNKVIEPRFAFNYSFNTERQMQLRGGVGLFQSVPPYVWLTNPYTNNGAVSSKQYTSTNPVADPFSADPYNQPGVQSSALPAGVCVRRANCQIDVLDPDFKLPTAWKFSLGLDAELPWGLTGTVEYQKIKHKDAIAYILPNVGTPNGVLPDGRLSYWQTYPNASSTQVGNGSNNGSYPEIFYRSTLLTNTDKGGSDSLTFSLSKAMSNGFSGNFSITQTRSTEVNPGTSSQAYSNYNYVARTNPNEIVEAPSRYDIPLSVKTSLTWEHAFFGDNKTTVSLFYNGRSGQPYSWVFGGSDVNGDAVASNVDLAYIPLANDPLVTYKAGTTADQIAAFQAFISNDAYLTSRRGNIADAAGRGRTNPRDITQIHPPHRRCADLPEGWPGHPLPRGGRAPARCLRRHARPVAPLRAGGADQRQRLGRSARRAGAVSRLRHPGAPAGSRHAHRPAQCAGDGLRRWPDHPRRGRAAVRGGARPGLHRDRTGPGIRPTWRPRPASPTRCSACCATRACCIPPIPTWWCAGAATRSAARNTSTPSRSATSWACAAWTSAPAAARAR
jgi:hypothetical protein